MEELQISDILSILQRKARLGLILGAIIMAVALLFAFTWKQYTSQATIEIAQPEVPHDVISSDKSAARAAIRDMADLRINRLLQKISSTGTLVEIITKYDLYSKERLSRPVAVLAEKMRNKIKIEFLSGSAKAGGSQSDPIAFRLAFSYTDPLLAQRVTNELVSRFLDEDMKEHRTKAQEISAFLESQLKVLEENLVEQERQIAEFRTQNGDVRPEALAFNQQTTASLSMSLQSLESQITTNMGTQGALRAQLASMDPYSRVSSGDQQQILSTPTTMLRGLKSEYASLKAKYGPTHPDVLKLSRQIEALEAETGQNSAPEIGALKARLDDVKTQLAAARKTYGPENPTIQSLEKQEKGLAAQIATMGTKAASGKNKVTDADNPAYLNVQAQLQSTEEQYKALMEQKKALMEQIEKYRNAVVQNPEAEKKLASLTRDYDNAQMRYRELKAKKMDADMMQTVEQDRTGERLVILNPPELPFKTTPARSLFALGGLCLALFVAAAVAFGSYAMNPTVVSPLHFEALTGTAPLILVPRMISEKERILISPKTLKKPLLAAGAALLLLLLIASLSTPLDVLWASALQTLGLY